MMFSLDGFAHLRIPLKKILVATDNFATRNLLGEHAYAQKYRGHLSHSREFIDIMARLFKEEREDRDELFCTEVWMLASLKHKNLVSIIGFCDENGEKIIIYKLPSRASLWNHLSDTMSLTWVRRLEICVGLANLLSYMYYDKPRDFSVIHRHINCYTVCLNDDWEPMLMDWELALRIKASERHHSFHTHTVSVWDREGYVDQKYLETNSVNHKADMYSFGIVLFEIMCGRPSMIHHQDNKYLAPMAIFHYREKLLHDIIDPALWKQMDSQSFNVFAQTAYDCLNEERSLRPNIDEIVTRLESALKLQMERQTAEQSIVAAEVEDTSSNHDKGSLTSISTHVSRVSKETKSFLKDLSHLKLSPAQIAAATNHLDDENIIEQFNIGRIYKGRLLHSEQFLDVIVKIFYIGLYTKDASKKFWTEISMLSSLKHKNIVSLVGFYEDVENKVIIYKKEANRSLKTYLSDQTLTWMQRLKICVGVARALSYIHYDCERDFSVIHCNIRSSKILLDDEWEPKLSGFELSLKNTVGRRHHLLLTRDIVENVYMDPKYKKTGGVTHKSDVYSFGVVLFQVLCGRSAVGEDNDDEDDEDDDLGEGLLSQLTKSHLDEMIDPHLRRQIDPESFKIFSETAYWCIKDDRADRPYIHHVVKKLEKALELQWKHENPVNRTSSNQLKVRK